MSPASHIERVQRPDAADLDRLAALLVDVVDGGASVGFHPPLSARTARDCWREAVAARDAGTVLWVARGASAPDRILGTVQPQRAGRANGRHRAAVCTPLVLHEARRSGVASQLMAALENHARTLGLAKAL